MRYRIVLLILLGVAFPSCKGVASLLLPQESAVLARNSPGLVWEAVDADSIEIWIDGVQMGQVNGDQTRFTPFPLSFGEHSWWIVSSKDGAKSTSEKRHFTIDDDPLSALPVHSQLLRYDWKVRSSEFVGLDGEAISSSGLDAKDWKTTSVPATALTALIRNGEYPNPYVGLNNMRIPDASDEFNAKHGLLEFSHIPGKNPWEKPYWYRKVFELGSSVEGERIWLNFNEICYRAEVWLNGELVASPSTVVGMERSFRFDVTKIIRQEGENVLAVAIYPLDVSGEPSPPPVTPLAEPGRNMGADGKTSLNYAKWDTLGWDWQPAARDRDMGIVEDVYLEATSDVEARDLYIAADLELSGTKTADLHTFFEIVNHAGDMSSVTVLGKVLGANGEEVASVRDLVDVEGGEAKYIVWDREVFSQLRLSNPQLWWPAGYGDQNLYAFELSLLVDGRVVHQTSDYFGVRKFETYISPEAQSRVFRVNGQDIFCRGGNWVLDLMLNWNAERYEQEIVAARNANLNFLRVWGPTGVPPKRFFEAADRHGVLIWQDFLHDFWGTNNNDPELVPEFGLFEEASIAIVKKCRNHPSLFMWCGGNEGPNPRGDLLEDFILPVYDPLGSRYYLLGSDRDGLQGGGPYHNVLPREYFGNSKISGFNSEIGPSGIPEWESLTRFLSLRPEGWAEGRYPIDGEWAYHDATERPGEYENRKFTHYDNILRRSFGSPVGDDMEAFRDWARKSQLVNYDAYRSPIEALNKGRWSTSTGFALWKFNASWPSLTWQLFDWYLQPHAGYYSLKQACSPSYAQYNRDDGTLAVVNQTLADRNGWRLEASLYDATLALVWDVSETVGVAANSVNVLRSTKVPLSDGVHYLVLKLYDSQGGLQSRNFYWLSANDDFTELENLSQGTLLASVHVDNESDSLMVEVDMEAEGAVPAILVRAKVVDKRSGEELLPTWWSDNYVSLLPEENARLSVSIPFGLDLTQFEVELKGFNLEPLRLSIVE